MRSALQTPAQGSKQVHPARNSITKATACTATKVSQAAAAAALPQNGKSISNTAHRQGIRPGPGKPHNKAPHAPTTSSGANKAAGAADELNTIRLSDRQLLQFERKGFIVTRKLLPSSAVEKVKHACEQAVQQKKLQALRHRVRVLCPGVKLDTITSEQKALDVIHKRGSSDLGFLQFFNLHRDEAQLLDLARKLAPTAAHLLGVPKLRLYQDCLFLKEPGYAETNWHSDLRMAPFDCNSYITAWIPLRPIRGTAQDSGLLFASGSHRDFALPFWHELQGRDLSDRKYEVVSTGPMELGDVSWHHGWLLHSAAPQPPGTPARLALSISYFADGSRLLARRSDPTVKEDAMHGEDMESYDDWLKECKDGAIARHALLPLVYP